MTSSKRYHRQSSAVPRDPFGYETHWLTVEDGSRLAYQTIGAGPPVILVNGLGGTFHAWRHLYLHLAQRFRILSWDFRGTHDSDPPRDRDAIEVVHHVDDLELLLDHWGVDKALFLGWSMGVQVNFELFKRRPDSFAGIGVINGTAGRAFDPLNEKLSTRAATAATIAIMKNAPVAYAALVRATASVPGVVSIAKRLGFIAPSLDEDVFYDLAGDFAGLDFEIYGRMLASLGEHDAWDVLPNIQIPVTIISGDKDIMTPVESAAEMSRLIPDSRLVVIPGSTHYAPVENAPTIIEALDQLVERCTPWT